MKYIRVFHAARRLRCPIRSRRFSPPLATIRKRRPGRATNARAPWGKVDALGTDP